jgi:hypothetical protein
LLRFSGDQGGLVPVDPGVPLRPQLERLEEKIEKTLDEVCASPPVKSVDTGELIKIEETLAIAAIAAKEAVSLRRRLRQDREQSSGDEGQQELPGV